MDLIVPFLRDIHDNDSREWYLANTETYFKAFDRNAKYIQKLIGLIGEFDPTIAPLKLHQCSFSLLRDSHLKIDDRKYNDFLSGSFTRGGKYSGYASYYYQISPEPSCSGGSFLAVGLYQPNRELLDYFRRRLVQDPESVAKAIESSGFEPYANNDRPRVSSRYNVEPKYEKYLYMRHMLLILPLNLEWFYQDDWCEKMADIFERCKPFVDLVNNIIEEYRMESPLPVGHGLRPIKKKQREYAIHNAEEIMAKRRATMHQERDAESDEDAYGGDDE